MKEVSNVIHERVLTKHIIEQLGKPSHLKKIHIKNLAGKAYRINVEIDKAQGKSLLVEPFISDSFYIELDSNDEISFVNPPLQKRY